MAHQTPSAFKYVAVFQSLSQVWLFATPWTAICQSSLSLTVSQRSLKFMSIELVMPANHLTPYHHLSFQKTSFIADGNTKWYNPWKIVWWFLTKLNALLLSNHISWYYPWNWKLKYKQKNCTLIIISVLFIFDKIYKQPKCPSLVEWINCNKTRQ